MINKIFKSLSKEQRQELITAFEQEFTLILNLSDDTFIGVNVVPSSKYLITEKNGVWAIGKILKGLR